MTHVVVIGAGQAGSALVVKLRNIGFEGDITLIGAENAPPYQRPPLSKKYLLGEMDLERLYLKPEVFYSENGINLRKGKTVTQIDLESKTLQISDDTVTYDHLVFTTGSSPRYLPATIGGTLDSVYVVRCLSDVDAMVPEFGESKHVLIIGGGYIGLEAAAVAASKGLKVTLVEMADRLLQRVSCPQTSDYFRKLHRSKGVKIIEGVGLDHLIGEGRVTGARLTDGTELDIDFAIAGVGIVPEIALAADAGVAIENGIKTDAHGQTSQPNIWAAGDCASFPYKGGRIRLESVPNAIEQAEIVAENIMGLGKDYIAKPWFWSDQYDVKLQIAGLNTGYDDVITRMGNKDGIVSFWYFRGDQLLAVDAMNDPRSYMIGKSIIEAGKTISKAAVSNPETDLKSLM